MQKWEALLHKTDLAEDELRAIPASSCNNWVDTVQYYLGRQMLSEREIFEGLEEEHVMNRNNWLDPIQHTQLTRNILSYAKAPLYHDERSLEGALARLQSRSLVWLLIKAMPFSQILKAIGKLGKKLNNFGNIEAIANGKNDVLMKLETYPFAKPRMFGWECRFVEGTVASILTAKGIRDYSIHHVICDKTLASFANRFYSRFGWKYKEEGDFLFINDQRIGQHVQLSRDQFDHPIAFPDRNTQNEGPIGAVRVLQDFNFNQKTIFSKGEIFAAPYCLIRVQWKSPSLAGRIQNLVKSPFQSKISFEEIDGQIDFTNQKLFEAQQSLVESERKSRIFKVYTQESLVQAVDLGTDPTKYAPKQSQMAILFCDLANFTTFSESLSPMDTVKFLNSYFQQLGESVSFFNGEIDKLMGDSIMARFSDPGDAVRAAIQMKKKLIEYNRNRLSWGLQKVANGIGVTFGKVVLGNIGSKGKLDYTLIGDTVNVASRLEALTRHYQVGIIISEDVKAQLGKDFDIRFLDVVQVKGRIEPIAIYEVYDYEPDEIKTTKKNIEGQMQMAFAYYREGDITKAHKIYGDLVSMLGRHRYIENTCLDPLLHFYEDRCKQIMPEVKDGQFDRKRWKGIYAFRKK